MASEKYTYQPKCAVPGCDKPAVFKVGAIWSDGTFTELKNFGCCCVEHRARRTDEARAMVKKLHLAEGESLGEVTLYQLMPGARDVELAQVGSEG